MNSQTNTLRITTHTVNGIQLFLHLSYCRFCCCFFCILALVDYVLHFHSFLYLTEHTHNAQNKYIKFNNEKSKYCPLCVAYFFLFFCACTLRNCSCFALPLNACEWNYWRTTMMMTVVFRLPKYVDSDVWFFGMVLCVQEFIPSWILWGLNFFGVCVCARVCSVPKREIIHIHFCCCSILSTTNT